MSNFRNVLKVFTMMRDFEPDDHALLNTLRGVTEAEREMLVEALGPVRRTTAKRTRKSSKSPRAASLGTRLQQVRQAPDAVCAFVYADGNVCGESWANALHDENAGYAGHHKYIPAAAQAAAGGE